MPSVITTTGNTVSVSYPVKEQVQTITKAEANLILALYDRKVTAIKFIRTQYNIGLWEAKQVVDTVCSTPAI